MPSGPFTLSNGDLRVEIDPGFGGRVTGFWSETPDGRVDWLVPAPDAGRDPALSVQAGMFPLVPFSNRVENARFRFAGREWRIKPTQAGRPHAIHGHGSRVAWEVLERDGLGATLGMTHDGSDWPAAYEARQRFDLRSTGLLARMEVTNTGASAMPVGLGWHPFLPLHDGPEITASFKTIWPPVQDSIPTAAKPMPPEPAFEHGALVPSGLDTGFGGWSREALISWPSSGAELRIAADEGLDHVIIYTPAGRDYFCFEPVTHPINAINAASLGGEDGMAMIDPGEKFGTEIVLCPRLDVTGRP